MWTERSVFGAYMGIPYYIRRFIGAYIGTYLGVFRRGPNAWSSALTQSGLAGCYRPDVNPGVHFVNIDRHNYGATFVPIWPD